MAVALVLAASWAAPSALAAEPWTVPIFLGPPSHLASGAVGSHPASAAPRGPKPPPPPAPLFADVETAEQLYAKLEFDEANKVADRVIKLRGLTHDQLVRAYKILAVTHAFLDREDQARDAFVLLMTYEPDYQVDVNLGPKVTTPFYEARGFWRSQSNRPGVETTASIRAQEPGAIRVTTRDPTRIVRRVSVGYRWTSAGDFTTAIVSVGTGISVDIPTPPQGKTRLEYYAQALDDRDDVAFETGNPTAPKTAIIDTQGIMAGGGGGANDGEKPRGSDKGGSSLFSSPVFWTVTGVLVVGGATTAFLALRPKDVAAPTQATLTPTLQCGTTKCN